MDRRWVSRLSRQIVAKPTRRLSSDTSGPRDYMAAVATLNSLQSNFSAVEAIRQRGPGWNKRAIPDMISWVRRIGYEPSDFDRVNPIHIAGTKGKGSTSTFISSILKQYLPTPQSIQAERLAADVGLYTSPHLRFVRERIQINNQPISEELFAKCFWTIWDRLEATPSSRAIVDGRVQGGGKPVYFHYLTLMALHCYLEQNVGTAVIECGIGGEYDTTNVLVKPSVTGITSLGIDHQSMLGDTIESIAWHKAGIFKKGVPAFTVAQPEGAMSVLHERARERKTGLHVVDEHKALHGITPDFKRINMSLAIAVAAMHLRCLGYSGVPDPFDSSSQLPTNFVSGLNDARIGGRCDLRLDNRVNNLKWYIDGGHTVESIDAAARWYAAEASNDPDRAHTRVLIFNQQTRDALSLVRRLHSTLSAALENEHPFTHVIFCSNSTYRDTGYKPDLISMNTNKDDLDTLRVQHELADCWAGIDGKADVHVERTIEEAITRSRNFTGEGKGEVLVTGSLHLVGGLIEILESEVETQHDIQ